MGLTKREREIVDLIVEGHGNKEIARRLYLSVHTVKSHVRHILRKTGSRNRIHVMVYVRQGERQP